ncbi:uncharacterized protein LOC111600195 [Drosophila hydei]|nr:uncharacterized protein LOC111600195 [Drosophila hydei]
MCTIYITFGWGSNCSSVIVPHWPCARVAFNSTTNCALEKGYPKGTIELFSLFLSKMSHGERKGRLNVVKFLELAFSVACLVLHFYSFNDRDIMTSFMATGTFTGYIIVVIGVFAGVLMRAPIHKRIDIFFSVLGCALFVASGIFIIEAWEFSFRTRTRDLALIKASLSIVNGVLFGFDAIFTFRDK